jgi:HSP20 family protein
MSENGIRHSATDNEIRLAEHLGHHVTGDSAMAKEHKAVRQPDEARDDQPVAMARWRRPLEEMDRLLGELMPAGWARAGMFERSLLQELAERHRKLPRVDVLERENEIVVSAELPGVDKKDLDVSVTEDSVSIKASTSKEEKEEHGDYYRCEISRGSYSRVIPLPAPVDADSAKASFKDGLLELTLPKSEPAKRRRVNVE